MAMAVMSSYSPILSPPLSINNYKYMSNLTLAPISTRRLSSTTTTTTTTTTIICSNSKRESGLTSKDIEMLVDKYGVDPNQLLSDSDSNSDFKTTRRRMGKTKGRGRKILEESGDAADNPHRTTHKLLQVLAGTAKRKKLLSPKGMDVRPMMEVVKGAAFDILQAAGGCPASLRPGRWLDLYSGTGSVGIEAISRGCSEVHFVEMDPWVVTNVLQPNLEWTGFLDVSSIHTVRVEAFLERVEQFIGKGEKFDYISVTPPYMLVDYAVLMSQIANSPMLGENSFILVEYPLRTDMLDSCGCLVKVWWGFCLPDSLHGQNDNAEADFTVVFQTAK
ncbi:hypothetical protein ACFE04_010489 [Oxalis oulophora]